VANCYRSGWGVGPGLLAEAGNCRAVPRPDLRAIKGVKPVSPTNANREVGLAGGAA
jgi:hypothetical protein